MILNKIISSWLNGNDYYIQKMSHRPYDYLLNQIKKVTSNSVLDIPEAYNYFYGNLEPINEKHLKVNKKLDENKRKEKFLRPVFELRDYSQSQFTPDEIFGFYVHGSLSTMDYIEGYSDFDTLVVIKKEVFEDLDWLSDFKTRLARSNTYLYLLDPLQHHNHFIITEYDLNNYFESIFPLVLFDYATELTDYNSELHFKLLPDDYNRFEVLSLRKYYFSKLWPEMGKLRAYDMKNAIQNILLLPALYLQLKTGQYMYKKDTFNLAKLDFSEEQWSVVKNASRVRMECQYKSYYPYSIRKFIGLHLHYKFLHGIHRYLDRNNSDEMYKLMGDNFLDESLDLVNDMLTKLEDIHV